MGAGAGEEGRRGGGEKGGRKGSGEQTIKTIFKKEKENLDQSEQWMVSNSIRLSLEQMSLEFVFLSFIFQKQKRKGVKEEGRRKKDSTETRSRGSDCRFCVHLGKRGVPVHSWDYICPAGHLPTAFFPAEDEGSLLQRGL